MKGSTETGRERDTADPCRREGLPIYLPAFSLFARGLSFCRKTVAD
jgi:hypothetical protein